jgi:hypothetical protein
MRMARMPVIRNGIGAEFRVTLAGRGGCWFRFGRRRFDSGGTGHHR